jgi:hypothetical protein
MELEKHNFGKRISKIIDDGFVEESDLILKNINGSALSIAATVCVCVEGENPC